MILSYLINAQCVFAHAKLYQLTTQQAYLEVLAPEERDAGWCFVCEMID